MWKNGPIWSGGENFKRSISFAEFGVKIMPHVLFMQFEYPNWSGQMGWRPLMCYKFTMSSRLPRRLKHFIERADVDKREIQIQNFDCHTQIPFWDVNNSAMKNLILSKLRIQHAYLFFLLFLYSITETFYWETKGKSKFKTYTHLDCYAQKLLWEARTNIMIKLLSISSENSKCMGLFRIESNVISRLSCLKELLVPKNCYSVEWIFIGPRSDHSLPMSVTDSLTDSVHWVTTLLKMEWIDPCWRNQISKQCWYWNEIEV